jgi:hypothetical protein
MEGDSYSGDSDSSSGSDSGGSGSGWGGVADVVWTLFDNDQTPSNASGASVLRQRREAEQAERHGAFDAVLFRLINGSSADAEKRSLLQEIVERDAWFVPVRADGSCEIILARDRQYGLAIGAGPNRREKGRQPARGKGGRLLTLFV